MIIRGATEPTAMAKSVYDKIKRGGKKVRWTDGRERQEEKKRERVQCRICNAYMCKGSLKRHMREQQDVTTEQYPCRKVSESCEFHMGIKKDSFNACPVKNCSAEGRDNFGYCRHFCLRHAEAPIVIQEYRRLKNASFAECMPENGKAPQTPARKQKGEEIMK